VKSNRNAFTSFEPSFLSNIDRGMSVGATTVDIEGKMKVLRKLASATVNADGTRSILLQHILPTTIEYVDIINSVYPVDLVISIVYSNHQPTVDALRAKGYNVFVPPSIEYMKTELWKKVVETIQASASPFIFQEVGGYMAEWTHELAKCQGFKGCVEDTKGGLWRYQAAANASGLKVPILSMADTALKRVEDSLIGDACVYSLEKVLRTQLASILDGLRCGVVGWGNIGKSCATAFEGRNAVVSVYDINPVINMLAYGRGFYPMPLAQLLAESDIVMGCSGRRSIRVADINDIKNGSILCSASSKDIEIDLRGFANLCDIADLTPTGVGLCPIEKYTVRETGKHFYILKNGTPIDFLDMPLQGAILDCTFSELFVCMRELSTNPHAPGILELADALQLSVAQKWLPTYAETFSSSSALNDKTFFFPDSWNWQ
jgi:S-adenosylhomocysteine hydrolase